MEGSERSKERGKERGDDMAARRSTLCHRREGKEECENEEIEKNRKE